MFTNNRAVREEQIKDQKNGLADVKKIEQGGTEIYNGRDIGHTGVKMHLTDPRGPEIAISGQEGRNK